MPTDDVLTLQFARLHEWITHVQTEACRRLVYVLFVVHILLSDARTPVWYQDRVVQLVKTSINHLGTVQGRELTRRPQHVTWFVAQLSMYVCRFISSSTYGSCLWDDVLDVYFCGTMTVRSRMR